MAPTPKSPHARRRHVHRLLAVLFAILIAALVAEGILRLVGYAPTYADGLKSFHVRDPETGYRGKPNFVGRLATPEFSVTITHDENGFRQQESHNEGADRRVFVLGDSFVWGWGVQQGECFTDVLSRRRPDLDVRNLGLNGSGTVAQSRIFDRHVRDQIRPGDQVVLVFCSNDLGDNVRGSIAVRVDGDAVEVLGPRKRGGTGLRHALSDHSRLFNLVDYTLGRFRARSRRDAAVRRSGLLTKESDEVVVTEAMIRHLLTETRARGGEFVLTLIPYPLEYGESSEAGGDMDRAAHRVREAFGWIVEGTGADTIELVPAMAAQLAEAPERRLSYAADLHWTAEGHALVGELLAKHLPGEASDGERPPPGR